MAEYWAKSGPTMFSKTHQLMSHMSHAGISKIFLIIIWFMDNTLFCGKILCVFLIRVFVFGGGLQESLWYFPANGISPKQYSTCRVGGKKIWATKLNKFVCNSNPSRCKVKTLFRDIHSSVCAWKLNLLNIEISKCWNYRALNENQMLKLLKLHISLLKLHI